MWKVSETTALAMTDLFVKETAKQTLRDVFRAAQEIDDARLEVQCALGAGGCLPGFVWLNLWMLKLGLCPESHFVLTVSEGATKQT